MPGGHHHAMGWGLVDLVNRSWIRVLWERKLNVAAHEKRPSRLNNEQKQRDKNRFVARRAVPFSEGDQKQ